MKLKVDENLPTEVAGLLREAGHDALTEDPFDAWTRRGELPPRKGTMVRADLVLTPEAQAEAWREWLAHGPQGPLEVADDDGPDER